MLEGKRINLRIIEKEDLEIYNKWINDINFVGEFIFIRQQSLLETEKRMFGEHSADNASFIMEKKDGTRIGVVLHFLSKLGFLDLVEIGYMITPEERGNGYCSEAVEIIVDYLFILKDIHRIQALIVEENVASQRVLEKNGFKKEGIIRNVGYIRGRDRDGVLYSIIREDWGQPRILTGV
ncbi:MAG: GNAT family N-acetyltransferase [Candidatus Thorarchaeota archaeon]|nr:GNAT family N-acetyltransferase [Candidatus Thorarchaeota archaeon]